MKRLLTLLVVLAALAMPAAAGAHPLGNFTTNHFVRVEASGDRLYALYVLDLAEIPTFQARAERRSAGDAAYARALVRRLARGLDVRVGGVRMPLRALEHELAFPAGLGGLRTTRLEVVFDAGELRGDGRVPVAVVDRTFAGRIGWREIVVRSALDARVASATAPSESVSDELRSYPQDQLQSPLSVREATASVAPGDRAGIPPSLSGDDAARDAAEEGGFASLITEEDLGFGVIVLMLGAALFWGAAHALTPGHGKAIVAAYLVGTRGTPKHAVMLGAIVTVTHTIGVFALGIVTLALSEFVVPEQLYPWLNLASAVLVVLVGVTVLRVRLLDWLRPGRRRAHGRHHHHHHDGHGHHHHDHVHDHHHGHGHSHVPEPGSGMRGLVAVGVSGGLLPCPTALVVLLAAISLHRVALGLVLIVAFSIGLASVITGIGLLAISAKRVFSRMSFEGGLVRALPAVSAVVIVCLGLAMTVRALPTVI